jgi:hypothetical protein
MKVGTFLYRPVPDHTQTKTKTEYRLEIVMSKDSIFSPATTDDNELERYKFEALTTIADALNARVLATKKVLAGLPKDAKVYTFDEKTGDALRCTFDDEFGWVCRTGHFGEALKLGRPYKIFAINDPKTAEYLRQFKREGVRRVGNV